MKRLGRLKRATIRVLSVLLVIVAVAAAYIYWPQGQPTFDTLASASRGYDVRILRDTWGVPHVFGVTDADCAFGLAYAHAEDDFLTIQPRCTPTRPCPAPSR